MVLETHFQSSSLQFSLHCGSQTIQIPDVFFSFNLSSFSQVPLKIGEGNTQLSLFYGIQIQLNKEKFTF